MAETAQDFGTKIELKLSGVDGNAFSILGHAMKALRRAQMPQETMDQFMREAQSGDYDHLLQTCMKWFDVS